MFLAIPLLIFQLFVTPYKRGFYCDDESIRYPYRDSTVSRQMLIVVGLVIPVVLVSNYMPINNGIFIARRWQSVAIL